MFAFSILFILSFIRYPEWFLSVLLVGQFITHFVFTSLGGSISRNNMLDPILLAGFGVVFSAYLMREVATGRLTPDLSDDERRMSLVVLLIGFVILYSSMYAPSSAIAVRSGFKYFGLNALPFFLTLYAVKTPKILKRLVILIVIIGGIKSVLTLIATGQTDTLARGVRIGEGNQIAYFSVNSGIWFARQVSLSLISIITLAYLNRSNLLKPIFLFLFGFFMFMMFFAASRGPVLSAIAVVPMMFLLTERYNFIRVFGAVIAISFLIFIVYQFMPAEVLRRYEIDTLIDPAGSVSIRLKLYTLALAIFFENPILGIGAGGFQSINQNQAIWEFAIEGKANYAHNIFLEFAGDFGIIGLTLIVLLVWHTFQICVWCYQNSTYRSEAFYLTIWIIAIFGIALLNAQVSGHINTNEFVWVAGALALKQKEFLKPKISDFSTA